MNQLIVNLLTIANVMCSEIKGERLLKVGTLIIYVENMVTIRALVDSQSMGESRVERFVAQLLGHSFMLIVDRNDF